MMTIWHAFYLDQGSAESAQRLVVRHRVSLTFSLPGFYREKIRATPRRCFCGSGLMVWGYL